MIRPYTNAQLFEFINGAVSCMHATGVTGFVLMHNYKKIYNLLEDYNEIRNHIIMKYGSVNESGTYSIDDPDKLAAATIELADYDNLIQEVDIIKIPEYKLVDSGLTAKQMMAISWMLDQAPNDSIRHILGLTDSEFDNEFDCDDDDDESDEGYHYDVKNPPKDDRFD